MTHFGAARTCEASSAARCSARSDRRARQGPATAPARIEGSGGGARAAARRRGLRGVPAGGARPIGRTPGCAATGTSGSGAHAAGPAVIPASCILAPGWPRHERACRASDGTGSGLGGLWRVVVLNDDHNTFDHVAETLAASSPGSLSPTATASPTDPPDRLCDRLERPRDDAENHWEELDGAGLTMAPLEIRVRPQRPGLRPGRRGAAALRAVRASSSPPAARG